MGKYIRKTKTDGDVAVMEVTQSSLGVRTRAKTLALQRLRNSPPDPASYLQLRNRRLDKPTTVVHDPSKRHRQASASAKENSVRKNPNPGSGGDWSVSIDEEVGETERKNDDGCYISGDLGIEASFGENVLEVEGRERGTRESTPCNLVRDPNIITTPGSTTRSSGLTGANGRVRNSVRRDVPTANELDEFFTSAEKVQQKSFMDKYNFDPVTDKPLPGRFEWEKVEP